jgi:hypothetical protein
MSSFLREFLSGAHAEPQRYVLSADELGRIDKPVLIIWGKAEDGVFMSIADAKKKAALIPNARFEVCQAVTNHGSMTYSLARSSSLFSWQLLGRLFAPRFQIQRPFQVLSVLGKRVDESSHLASYGAIQSGSIRPINFH